MLQNNSSVQRRILHMYLVERSPGSKMTSTMLLSTLPVRELVADFV